MKITKQLSRPSLPYLIKDFLFLSVASFLLISVLLLIDSKSFEKLGSPVLWVILLGVALISSIVQGFRNRDGVLTIQEVTDMKALLNQIDLQLSSSFKREVSDDHKIVYYRDKSRLDKFFNWILQERPQVVVSGDSISIFARGELLKELETKIKEQAQA